MTSQSLISIYYALVYLILPMVAYCGVTITRHQLVRLQNKAVWIINNAPLRDHITPHYVNLGFIKRPDIVNVYTCQLFYDHLMNKKSSNHNLSLVSEHHHDATQSASVTTLKSRMFQNKYKNILSNYFRMVLLEWYSFIYTQHAN